MNNVDNNQDIIDSRDIIARIAELEAARDSWDDVNSWIEKNLYDANELCVLTNLARECEELSDWEHGETLIRYSYLVDYVQEMLEDCGAIPRDLANYIVIDWESTANNIAYDYMIVNYDDVDYYIRNC